MSSITQHWLTQVPVGVSPFNWLTLMGWQIQSTSTISSLYGEKQNTGGSHTERQAWKKTDKREEDSADGYENDPTVLKWKVKISVPLFSSFKCLPQKCSMATICKHCVSYHLLFQGEGETAYKNYVIHPFNQMPTVNAKHDNDIRLRWQRKSNNKTTPSRPPSSRLVL